MADPPATPIITFLSDYGLADDFVGICHGVIASICPAARVIDVTHGIPRHDTRAGAIVLGEALAYLPVGVHLAVVDPDVGAQRRAIALRLADGRLLVGPDNGLLSLAARAGGGIAEAADVARSPYRLQPVSATFHGRDIFAPVAAALAAGARWLRPASHWTRTTSSRWSSRSGPGRRRPGRPRPLHRPVRHLQLNAGHEELSETGLKLGRTAVIELADGTSHRLPFHRTFADAGRDELLLYEDAQQRLAIAVRHGDASARAGPRRRRRAADPSPVSEPAPDPPGPDPGAAAPLGRPRLHLRITDSTNTRARALAAAGAPHGTLVTAGEQTAGRGRQGRAWSAPPRRALLGSVVIRQPRPLLSLAAGIAVAEVAGRDARVKWPNDVLVDGRKIAGSWWRAARSTIGRCSASASMWRSPG